MRKKITLVITCLVLPLAFWALSGVNSTDEEYPVDYTSKITNPNLDDGLNGWTATGSGESFGVKAASTGNPVYTGFKTVFDVSQTIEGLPAGQYVLKVQAFSRPTGNADAVKLQEAGTEQESNCYIYANDVEIHPVNLTSEYLTAAGSGTWSQHTLNGQTIYLPDNSSAFADAFKRNMYDNELKVVIGSEGVLTIGVKNTSATSSIGDTYAGFDNFRLYYYGPVTNVTDEMVAELLAKVPTGDMNSEVQSALEAAIAALKAEATGDTYAAALDAVEAANISVNAYNNVKAALAKGEETTLTESSRATYNAAIASIVEQYSSKTLKGDGVAEVETIENAIDAAVKTDIANSNDKTGLIVNAQFDEGTAGWSGNFGNGKRKGQSSNYVITCYGGGFDVYQTIEGLTPGIYLLQAQAFTRPVSNADTWTAVQDGTPLVNETYLYGNDAQKKVKFIVDDYMTTQGAGTWSTFTLDGQSVYVPNNSDAFSVSFTAGLYENQLYCIVKEDGKLTFGIKNEDTENSASYAGFDNFRLTYVRSCDMTDLIANPQLDDVFDGWTVAKSEGGSVGVKAASTGNPVYTCYNGVFDIYQTLTGLIPGTYKLQVQAFSRPCDDANLDALLKSGAPLENFCYIYANDVEVQPVQLTSQSLPSAGSGTWASHTIDGQTFYLPNNSSAFADAFKRGMYDNELFVGVDEDGKLTIGARNETAAGSQGNTYTGFDNFRLLYISSNILQPEEEEEKPETLEDIIARVDNYKEIASQADDHSAFDAVYEIAIATLKNSESSEEAVSKATADITNAFSILLKEGETTTGQFDLTSLITNPSFDSNINGWKSENKALKWNSIGVVQGANVTDGDKLTQTLKGMPAGKYTLKVQGFYQPQGWKQSLYDYEHGKEVGCLSLILNDESKAVKSIFDDARNQLASACISRKEDVGAMVDGRGFPLMLDKVNDALAPGGYWNYVEVEVEDDGDITIGVSLDATELADNWVILDNFRLYYGEHKPIIAKSAVKLADDTPAEVCIVPSKPYLPDTLYAFSAPCDIDGKLFKAVYEIGSFNYNDREVTIFPVENVRAGVPCYVEFISEVDTLKVGKTVFKVEQADHFQVNWDGGVVYPFLASFNWRTKGFKNELRSAPYFNKIVKQDLSSLHFTGNIENYQVRLFMSKKYSQGATSVVADYNKVSPARRDLPHAIAIPVPASKSEGAVVKYSLKEDMTEAKTVNVYNGATLCYLPNLIPGNRYYVTVESGNEQIVKAEVDIEGPVRMIYAPSVYNLRDLGGYTVADGRVTRYGLIYRGGEVNGFHAPVMDDLKSLIDLGIGAELDLRYNDSYDQDRETNKSGYGFVKGDTYYFAGANDYTADHLSDPAVLARIKDEFHFLMKHIREGRGVHFHCVFGADRTGFYAVLLEGLLGFSLNDMYHDYEFTSFAAPAGNRNLSAIQERIAVVQAVSGKTLTEKYENFWLNNIGITAEEIEEFRNIMLEDPTHNTAIEEIEVIETEGTNNTIQAVYNISGTQVPENSLQSNKGVFVVKYTNGSTKKMIVK